MTGRVPVLSRPMVLEAPERIADGAGGYSRVWRALGTIWADLRPQSGRDDFLAGQTVPRQGVRITVRAAPPGSAARPSPGQRLREGTRHFLIRTVIERDPAGRYLILQAEEGAEL